MFSLLPRWLDGILFEQKSAEGYVYVLSDQSNCYKIGRTNNLNRRLQSLNTGNHRTVSLVGYIVTTNPPALEKALHESLSKYHVKGEWFRYNPVDPEWVNLIQSLRRGV